MHTGIIFFLFDSGESAQESWSFNAASSDEALKRLNKVAQARLALLASSVRIVRLKVCGQPLQKVHWTGRGGGWAHPRDSLLFRNEGRETKRCLRGVPKEIFNDKLTPLGHQAFRSFNLALNECACVLVRQGRPPMSISQLEPTRCSSLSSKRVKKVTRTKLVELLGATEGQKFWDGLKAK